MSRPRLLVSVAAALAAVALATVPVAGASPGRADVLVLLRAAPASAAATAADHAARYGATVRHVYRHAVVGYAASLPVAALDDLRDDPAVALVEADRPVHALAVPWGLDRIDQRYRPLDGSYTPIASGSGVRAYIVDTGLYFAHPDFGGRAVSGYDAVDGGSADDCNGHGTHVAGVVGGATYGVAKSVRLVAVRVLNCSGSGSTSQVVAGLDWIVSNHVAGAPAVANISVGGPANTTLDAAVRRVISDGVSVSVAAGGSAADACNYSPARVAEAMTVGASDSADQIASFSNRGSCVDWYAPGVSIPSAWYDGGTRTISGTSPAAAHTAGVAAQYLQGNPSASPSTVQSALRAKTTKDVLSPTSVANNDLLYTDY